MRQEAFLTCVAVIALCSCQNNKAVVGQNSQSLAASTSTTPVSVQSPHLNNKTPQVAPAVLLVGLERNAGLSSIDDGDQIKECQAEARAFTAPIGQQVTWSNLDTHDLGTLTPLKDSYNTSGMYCRDFQQTLTLSGQQKQTTTKACQQSDGSWKLAN